MKHDPPTVAASDDSVAPYTAALPATSDAWTRMPPLQRTVADSTAVAPPDAFRSSLTSHQNPSFLAPLGHLVEPDGPSGVIGGLTAATGLPVPYEGAAELRVPERPITPTAPVAQRQIATLRPTEPPPSDGMDARPSPVEDADPEQSAGAAAGSDTPNPETEEMPVAPLQRSLGEVAETLGAGMTTASSDSSSSDSSSSELPTGAATGPSASTATPLTLPVQRSVSQEQSASLQRSEGSASSQPSGSQVEKPMSRGRTPRDAYQADAAAVQRRTDAPTLSATSGEVPSDSPVPSDSEPDTGLTPSSAPLPDLVVARSAADAPAPTTRPAPAETLSPEPSAAETEPDDQIELAHSTASLLAGRAPLVEQPPIDGSEPTPAQSPSPQPPLPVPTSASGAAVHPAAVVQRQYADRPAPGTTGSVAGPATARAVDPSANPIATTLDDHAGSASSRPVSTMADPYPTAAAPISPDIETDYPPLIARSVQRRTAAEGAPDAVAESDAPLSGFAGAITTLQATTPTTSTSPTAAQAVSSAADNAYGADPVKLVAPVGGGPETEPPHVSDRISTPPAPSMVVARLLAPDSAGQLPTAVTRLQPPLPVVGRSAAVQRSVLKNRPTLVSPVTTSALSQVVAQAPPTVQRLRYGDQGPSVGHDTAGDDGPADAVQAQPVQGQPIQSQPIQGQPIFSAAVQRDGPLGPGVGFTQPGMPTAPAEAAWSPAPPPTPGPSLGAMRTTDAAGRAPAQPQLQREIAGLPVQRSSDTSSTASSNGQPADAADGPGAVSHRAVGLAELFAMAAAQPSQDVVQRDATEPATRSDVMVQTADAAPVESAAAPAPGAAAPTTPNAAELEEMARRLYEPLSSRLRTELWQDRERAGLLTDLRP